MAGLMRKQATCMPSALESVGSCSFKARIDQNDKSVSAPEITVVDVECGAQSCESEEIVTLLQASGTALASAAELILAKQSDGLLANLMPVVSRSVPLTLASLSKEVGLFLSYSPVSGLCYTEKAKQIVKPNKVTSPTNE
ncbi:hypothetical protein MANI_021524 [Metarhizium anisopliae]|nr:hypothetical protein MANI_021524 [Metarhizium anisopliae]